MYLFAETHRLLILFLLFQFRVLIYFASSVFLSVQLCCIAFTLWNQDDGSKPPFGSNPMVIIAPKLSSVNIFSTSLDRNPKPEFFLCATLLVPTSKRNKFASSSPTSVKLCKQKKPLDTVSPFPQGNGFSDSVSFHLYNSNGRPKKKDHKHDISSSKVSTQFIKKSRGRPRTTL